MLSQPFELIIRQLCEDVLSDSTPEKLPQMIIDHVQSTFPVQWSTLWLTEQKKDPVGNYTGDKWLRLAAAAGSATKLLKAEMGGPAVYDFGEGLTGEIAEKRHTINITRPEDFARYGHKHKYDSVMYGTPIAGNACKSVLGVPLLLKSTTNSQPPNVEEWRVVGVLKLENIQRKDVHEDTFFSEQDAKIIEAYAAVIAVALEKAQMRADSLRIGQGLLSTSGDLLNQLGERPDLDKIVKQTANVISAEACALWLRSGLELRLAAAHGYPGVTTGVPAYFLGDTQLDGNDTSGRNPSKSEDQIYRRVGLTVYVAKATQKLNLKNADEVRGHFAWKGANDQGMWNKSPGDACYSLVAIPLVDSETNDLKGVFKIENKKPTIFQLQSYFTAEDEDLLTILGNSISQSLIISERVERLRRLEKLVGDIRVLEGLEEALFFILTGLTHNGGLQYNRAMVYLRDDVDTSRFVCQQAIGEIDPIDWQFAVEKEPEDRPLDFDKMLEAFSLDRQRYLKCPMMQRWRNHSFSIRDAHVMAKHAADPNVDTSKYLSGNLKSDDPLGLFAHGDFVLIPMRFEGTLKGIIYADHRFTGNRINKFECEVLDLFAGAAGAIIDASKVPQKLRKERDEAWRSFSGAAAHRLGTEGGIIDNEVNLYIRPELDGKIADSRGMVLVSRDVVNESLNVIRQSVDRLRRAVKDYQQLTSEPEPPEEFDLCELIDQTVSKNVGGLRGICVEQYFPAEAVHIRARRQELAYVLEELVINSWKQVDTGSGTWSPTQLQNINVSIRVEHDEEQVVCVVADDGPGIPSHLRSQLFEKHGKGRRGGTGLGLNIIAKIIKDHNGGISLVDDEKPAGYGGACFRIELPVHGVTT